MPKILKITALSIVLLLSFNITASAADTYSTYTYSYNGNVAPTPDAYLPREALSGSMMGAGDFLNPSDMFVDNSGGLIITDKGNNRIVFLDSNRRFTGELREFSSSGEKGTFNAPNSVYRTTAGELYVADTGNHRIVHFDKNLQYMESFGAPNTSLLSKDFVYNPLSLVVDASGRMYIVAESINMGIIGLSGSGDFEGFIGAQQVTFNLLDYIWKQILTKEQQQRMTTFVPTEYNNIVIDEDGFLYVTSSAINADELKNDIFAPSRTPRVSAVKRINPSGYDVLKRSGNISISGDIIFFESRDAKDGLSVIIDTALGEASTYTLLDRTKNRYFTYSREGRLLFAFGLYGETLGTTVTPVSIVYQGTDFLVLDKTQGLVTVYERTPYGDNIISALNYSNDYNYEQSVAVWNEVIAQNPNSEIGYNGLGISYLNDKRYGDAMEMFMLSYDATNYSKAFRNSRDEIIRGYFILLLLAAAVIVGIFMLITRMVKKVNKEDTPFYERLRHKLIGALCYAYYIIFHPFDGFYDMKHEKRGSMLGATLIMIGAVLTLIIEQIYTGFIFNPKGYFAPVNPLPSAATVFIPVILWSVSNWCFTSLLDGEGTLKDIYMSTCYSLTPIILLILPVTVLSQFLVLEEGVYMSMLTTLAYGWTFFLVFIGSMTVHQYSLSKNVVCTILTIVGIGIILFIVLLLATTGERIVSFVTDIVKEISFRT